MVGHYNNYNLIINFGILWNKKKYKVSDQMTEWSYMKSERKFEAVDGWLSEWGNGWLSELVSDLKDWVNEWVNEGENGCDLNNWVKSD